MQGETVERLADAAAEGDPLALRTLYDHLSPDLYGYLADMTRDSALAEDLLHEVWMTVMQRIGGRRGPVRAWVFSVARNRALDALRKRKRQRTRRVELTDVADSAEGPNEFAERCEEAERLRRAVCNLAPDHREVVLLRFYSGLPFREIAEVLGCPLGTAATRLRKALSELQKELHCEQRA